MNGTSDVLIEVLPVRYELLDVKPSGLRSVRTVRNLELASLELGPENHTESAESTSYTGRMPYAFERQLNLHVFDDQIHHRLIEGLSMRTHCTDIADLIYGHQLVQVKSAVWYFLADSLYCSERVVLWSMCVVLRNLQSFGESGQHTSNVDRIVGGARVQYNCHDDLHLRRQCEQLRTYNGQDRRHGHRKCAFHIQQ